jgi:hypothetical protein
MVNIPVDQIDLGDRRRTDLGNIASLAEGIRRVGLLEPILVDRNGSERYRLVFGERRLRAVEMLQQATIRAQLREHLSDEAFRAIELEENENRKALTEGERARTFESSRKLVENAKKAAEVLAQNVPKPPSGERGGRPAKPTSTRAVAAALGVSRTDVHRAEQHVETVERLPWMKGWKQAQVLAVRDRLEDLNEHEQQQVARILGCAPAWKPAAAIELVEKIVAKPRKEREQLYALSTSPDPADRARALAKAKEVPPPPDPRVDKIAAAIASLNEAVVPYPTAVFAPRLTMIIAQLRDIQAGIQSQPRL